MNGIRTAQVKDPTLASGNQAATRAGGSGKASRSADEIALVFTRNKGAIDSMYARALRDNPALQGKVVIELTITPSGDITRGAYRFERAQGSGIRVEAAGAHSSVQIRGEGRGHLDCHQTHRFLPCRMNIQSEIEFFSDLGLVDKARFVTRLIGEVAEEAKVEPGDGHDARRLRFSNRDDPAVGALQLSAAERRQRPPSDDVVIRMLLGTRADKNAERIMQNAYRRVLTSFESFDTTVLLNSH